MSLLICRFNLPPEGWPAKDVNVGSNLSTAHLIVKLITCEPETT
jgi:hypothetical protein